jgi:hypothetical protein
MKLRPVLRALSIASIAMVAGGCSEIFKSACQNTLLSVSSEPITEPALNEISGINAGVRNPDVLWAHNDSGDSARLFALDSTGAVRGSYTLSGATNVDWEDLAVVAGSTPGSGAIYAADIGDNAARRSEIQVYRIDEPLVPVTGPPPASTVADVETFRFTYPDGPHDAEALIIDPVSGDLTIISKSILGGSQSVYSAQGGFAQNSSTVLTNVGVLRLDAGVANAVTAADIAADGATIAVRTYGSVKLFHRRDTTTVADALIAPIGPCSVRVLGEAQGEAVGFRGDGDSFVTVSEGAGQRIQTFSAP